MKKLSFLPVLLWLAGTTLVLANEPGGGSAGTDVTLSRVGNSATISNGIVTAVINTSQSIITSLRFKGRDMIAREGTHQNIYFSREGGADYETLLHCVFSITTQTPDMVDVCCKHVYTPGVDKHAWDVEAHFVLRRGMTGLYVYTVNSHPASYPAMGIGEWRMVWPVPVNGEEFYWEKFYLDDLRHGKLATAGDYKRTKAVPGAPPEVTEFTTGEFAGKYDSKYVYAGNYWDLGCWGYASDKGHGGGWFVFGSYEYFSDGPVKQDLTCTQGGLNLVHLRMNHYATLTVDFAAGQEWKKVYGPFLIYFNDQPTGDACWQDAKEQAKTEAAAWPYAWLKNPAYPSEKERGTVAGRFVVKDALKPGVSAANAWVGLAQPDDGKFGGFQFQGADYEYWVHADKDGKFTIPHVRPGNYTLYAFTNGAVGEFSQANVTVSADQTTELRDVVWNVPHAGKKIAWEIGVPDRRSLEFKHGDDFFTPQLYWTFPHEFSNPLEYYAGKSDWSKDWNYAQSYYYEDAGHNRPVPHRWNIHFNLDSVPTGPATLTIAIAGSMAARLDVLVNGELPQIARIVPKYQGGNALVRQSDHAKYEVQTVSIPPTALKTGENVITLLQGQTDSSSSIMYDYLSLELP